MIRQRFYDYIRLWKEERGKQIALIDTERTLTYGQLWCEVEQYRTFFLQQGLRQGDRVVVSGPKRISWVVSYLSLFSLGVAVVPLPEKLRAASLPETIRLIQPHWLIDYRAGKWSLHALTKETGSIVIQPSDDDESKAASHYKAAEVDVYFNLTSGSTGQPRAVCVSSLEIIHNALAVMKRFPMEEEDCYCCLFPPDMHPHEIFALPLISGARCLLLTTSDLRHFAHYLRQWKLTHLHATPHMYDTLLHLSAQSHDWHYIKFPLVGGEYPAYSLRQRFYQLTTKKLIPVWGSTETTGIVLSVPSELTLAKESILGLPLPGYEVKQDEQSKVLLVRGDACARSYWNEVKPFPITTDGFYQTNDIVTINQEGVVFFEGRLDSVIKACGRKIALNQVEQQLQQVSGIEAAVVYDQKQGVVIIYLCGHLRSGLLQVVKRKLVELLSPIRYRFVQVDRLPRLPNGKLDRSALFSRREKREC